MKILFYFVTLIVLVNTKEKLSGLEQYFQDPRFWQFVEKRLDSKNEVKSKVPNVPDESPSKPKDQYDPINTHSESDNSEENVQSDKHQADLMEDTLGNLCQYRPNASLIIRSKASINNGAFFLKSFNKKTREECVNACCYTQGCNLIVYENKAEHNCYLFNCGTPSKCLFAEHANYTSMFFPNHAAPSSSSTGHQQQHENELEGLNSKETPKPTTNAPRKNVPLYGRCDIDWNEECSDRNAECRDGICKCSYGYHAKYGICRVDCPDSAFECENKGQGFNVPECISKDHVCDGQPQCADGSDEETCAPPPSDYKDSMVDEEGKNVPYDTTPKPTHRPSPRPRPTTPAKTTLAPDSSANKDKNPDQKTSIKEKDPDLQTADNKPAQPSPKTDKTLTPSSKNSTAQNVPDSSGLGGEVVESHVVVESPTDSHQGPIVALGLGLGITVILLFFVGCRLRNVKRRIRKGRALHSNEADYLINGMYL